MVPKKILVCTDFSDNSQPAVELAVEYAKAFGAQLIIFHAIDYFYAIDYQEFPSNVDWGEKLQEILEHSEHSANMRLGQLAEKYRSPVKEVKTNCLLQDCRTVRSTTQKIPFGTPCLRQSSRCGSHRFRLFLKSSTAWNVCWRVPGARWPYLSVMTAVVAP